MDDELEYMFFSFDIKKEKLKELIDCVKEIFEFFMKNDIELDDRLIFTIQTEDENKFEKIEINADDDEIKTIITKI